MELFPSLFAVVENQQSSVEASGLWTDVGWRWNQIWCRELRGEEQTEADLLEDILLGIYMDKNNEDRWIWLLDKSQSYKVNTTYNYLVRGASVEQVIRELKKKVMCRLWGTVAPSKFLVFVWRLLIPTRSELKQRGVLSENLSCSCVYCFREYEEIDHLLFRCDVMIQVSKQIRDWTDIAEGNYSDRWDHFSANSAKCMHRRKKKLRYSIWVATSWTIWITRNNVLFGGGCPMLTKWCNKLNV